MTATKTSWPRIGPNQRRVLQAIAKTEAGMTTPDVAALGLFVDPRQHQKSLESLQEHGLLAYFVRLEVWRITQRGTALLANRRPQDGRYVGVIAQPRRMAINGTYDGAELRPQQARPAGNNHFTIPSLIGGQRVMRRAD